MFGGSFGYAGGGGGGGGGAGAAKAAAAAAKAIVDPPKPAQPLPARRDVPEWATFQARQQRPLFEGAPLQISDPKGHARPVKAMAWSCDGKLLATGGEDRNVKIWEHKRRVDPAAGTQRDHFELLTMDGLLPAIGTPSSSGTSSSKPTTADGTVLHVAFAPRDPSILAVTSRASPDVPVGGSSSSSSSSSSAAIKRVSEPTLISNKDSTNEVWSAATIAAHAKITIWDMTRRCKLAVVLLPYEPQSLVFHPSGHQLACVYMTRPHKQDELVTLWQPELVAREERDGVMFECASKEVERGRKEGERQWLKTLNEEGVSDHWEVRKDVGLGEPNYRIPSGDTVTEFNGAVFSPCGTRLYAGNVDGALYVWDFPIQSTRPPAQVEKDGGDVDMDGVTGAPMEEGDTTHDSDSEGKRSPIEIGSAAPTEDGEMKVDGKTGNEAPEEDATTPTQQSLEFLYRKALHNGCLNCLDLDPLRRYIVTGGSEGIVNLVDAAEWMTIKAYDSYTEEVRIIKFSWDGEFIAVAGYDRCIDIMSAATGSTIHRVRTPTNVVCLQWSPMRQTLCYALENHASGAAGRAGDWYCVSF